MIDSGDHLLTDTCTLAAYSTFTEDGSYDRTETYGTAATLACMVAPTISREWSRSFPEVDITRSIEIWLPSTSTPAPKDKVTWGSVVYRIVGVSAPVGIGVRCLAERIEGVTA